MGREDRDRAVAGRDCEQAAEIKNSSELEFAIFCIESVAARLGEDTREVYRALTEGSDILDHYIVANFEILHTQDKEYIVDDILAVMREEGAEV